jgi:hypothetical protein
MPQSPSSDAVRWQRALDRALANALDVLIEPISGEAFVESATKPGTLYQVTATLCTCTAGQKGFPCQHRACYLAQIGELPLPQDEPTFAIRPGDYLDVRTVTMVTITRDGAKASATWHDGHTGR